VSLFGKNKNSCAVHPKKGGVHTITRGFAIFFQFIVSYLQGKFYKSFILNILFCMNYKIANFYSSTLTKILMKKISVLIFVLLFTILAGKAQKQEFSSPNLKSEIQKHKIVAILPFKVDISYKKLPKGYDAEVNKAQESKDAFSMQDGMYTYLLRKADKYTVDFQDVQRTNLLLKKAGLADKLDETLQDSICRALKVDAVIKCSYAYEKTGSEAGAIATAVLFGVGGKVATGTLTMQINNGTNGEMLWRYYNIMKEAAFTSSADLMERTMRKVSRNFPYEKD